MKITEKQLRKIIKEERQKVIAETKVRKAVRSMLLEAEVDPTQKAKEIMVKYFKIADDRFHEYEERRDFDDWHTQVQEAMLDELVEPDYQIVRKHARIGLEYAFNQFVASAPDMSGNADDIKGILGGYIEKHVPGRIDKNPGPMTSIEIQWNQDFSDEYQIEQGNIKAPGDNITPRVRKPLSREFLGYRETGTGNYGYHKVSGPYKLLKKWHLRHVGGASQKKYWDDIFDKKAVVEKG